MQQKFLLGERSPFPQSYSRNQYVSFQPPLLVLLLLSPGCQRVMMDESMNYKVSCVSHNKSIQLNNKTTKYNNINYTAVMNP